jgi:hypothetical protein
LDGTPRQPRYGMMTTVVETRQRMPKLVICRAERQWNSTACQQIPELQGIKSPISIPGLTRYRNDFKQAAMTHANRKLPLLRSFPKGNFFLVY